MPVNGQSDREDGVPPNRPRSADPAQPGGRIVARIRVRREGRDQCRVQQQLEDQECDGYPTQHLVVQLSCGSGRIRDDGQLG